MSASTAATPALTRGNPKILRFLSDDRLAALAARGTPDAFALIYERHHQGIYRYCRSILGNAHDASDALQNTMTSVLQALPGERREIALKSWLYRIAHNESISLLRRRRPQVDLKHAEALPAPDMAEDIASRERMAQLWSDLEELPERQRAALVMRELSGLSHDEIAASLEVSPGAAKQAVFEARQALRDLGGGRAMDCRHVQERISDGDGRRLWARKIRSHLRSCDDCQAFQVALGARRNDLAALAPPLAPAAAAALLHGVVGGGGAGTGGGLLSLLGGGAGKAAGATTAFKMSAAVAVSVVAGGTAAVASHEVRSNRDERPAEARADRADAGTRGSTARSPGGGPDERRREKRTPSSAAADSAGERSRERKAASNRGGHRRRVRPAKPTRPPPPAHPAAGRAGARPTRRTPSPARGSAPAAGNAGTARGGRGSASATAPTPPTPSAPTPPAPPVTPPARPSAAP
jgi:RNA polymerase sigma factor (sigma-70 family)